MQHFDPSRNKNAKIVDIYYPWMRFAGCKFDKYIGLKDNSCSLVIEIISGLLTDI